MVIKFDFAQTGTGQEIVRDVTERVERESTERMVAAVLRGMRARFGRDLPADVEECLREHTQEQLYEVVAWVAIAASAAEALDIPPGITPR